MSNNLSLEYGVKYNLLDIYNQVDSIKHILHHQGYKIYKITNEITNQSYIGDTKISIYYRFFCSNFKNYSHFQGYQESPHKMYDIPKYKYNSMRKYGLENFTLEILPHSEELTEEYYIKLFNSYYDWNKGFNSTANGKGNYGSSTLGRVSVFNGSIFKYIPKNLIEDYMKMGYHKSHRGFKCKGKIHMTKDDITYIRVHANDTENYINLGYKIKNNTQDTVYFNDGVNNYRINYLNQDKAIESGLIKGMIVRNRSDKTYMINLDGEIKLVLKSDKLKLMSEGWRSGRDKSNPPNHSGKRRLWKSGISILVDPEDINNKLKEGYFLTKRNSL